MMLWYRDVIEAFGVHLRSDSLAVPYNDLSLF